jgi:hypothetical protein
MTNDLARLNEAATQGVAELVEALRELVEEYVCNVDATRLGGFYTDPETEECVKHARTLLAKHGDAGGKWVQSGDGSVTFYKHGAAKGAGWRRQSNAQ